MVYLNILHGGYKKVIKRLMYFSYRVIQIFLGVSSSTKKYDWGCDQILIKKGGDLYTIHMLVK